MTPIASFASLAPALPEIWLTVAACIVLLTDAFAGRSARRITPTLTLLLLALGAAAILVWGQVDQRVDLFSGMYTADPLATVLKLLSFLFTAVALLYSRHWLEARGLLKGEYYVLVLTALICNLIAIAQTNLKRMLAYSAIGNVGFILLGFVAGTERGYEAALFYTIAYVIMALGSFGVIVLAGRRGFEADELDHYKGLHSRDPLLAVLMMMMMFSTAGIPPFVGFWAKLQIFEALWASGHAPLVVFGAAVSVIGVFYYLRVVKLMYFDAPGDLPVPERHTGVRFTLAINAAAVVALGLFPQALLELCQRVLP